MKKSVEELSGGRILLGTGTLYGALARLEKEGLVEPDREEVHGGRTRRYYRLTKEGETVLQGEVAARETTLRRVQHQLRISTMGGMA